MFNKTLLKIAYQLLDDIGDLVKKQAPARMNSFEVVDRRIRKAMVPQI